MTAILATCSRPIEIVRLPQLTDTHVPAAKTHPPPSSASVTHTLTFEKIVTLLPLESPSLAENEIAEGTPLAGLEIPYAAPQLTETAMTPAAIVTLGNCRLEPVTQPVWPIKILLPNELDPETGLHITGNPKQIDLVTYRLKVTGLVEVPLSLTYDDIRCLPRVTDSPELVCPGVFVDKATWTGVPIKVVLELAGVQQGATKLRLISADGREVNLSLEEAIADGNFLAFELNNKLLPVQHGFPLRAVFPSMPGSFWLKWLIEIRIS
jgi:DMSO/TMAO reductase YedYZ molybdopterin-dependent catalytic subunit